jgi:hypothetical protein
MKRALRILFVLTMLTGPAAAADEGMWLFNNFPSDQVRARYGFAPSPAWLDHVRQGAVRLARGCSGSFVSPQGLVLTNHHCAQGCLKGLSSASRDLLTTGFWAKEQTDEEKCPDVEINQLVEIKDVTGRIQAATRGKADVQFNEALKTEMSRIEAECAQSDRIRCDVVTLYNGGLYHLYRYRRYQDVRLVFAPEFAAAFFGGDPDNFEFPRYDFDVAFFRAYEDDRPAAVKDALRWSSTGVKEGELTFVAGHPGSTSRQLTVAQLEYRRDVSLPEQLIRQSELRGLLTEFGGRGGEERRVSAPLLFYTENSLKAGRGRHAALGAPVFFQKLRAAEGELRAKVQADAAVRADAGGAWDAIAQAMARFRTFDREYRALEVTTGGPSELFGHARALLRLAHEKTVPNEKRLREYSEAALPALRQRVLSTAPIEVGLEELLLTFSLTKLREDLGPDHPVVKQVLGKRSPGDVAKTLITGTRLTDPKVRTALWNGGKAVTDPSTDALLALVRQLDGPARAIRKRYEDEVEAVVKRASEAIARASFKLRGTGTYPDATFTLRLTYGQVKGYAVGTRQIAPMTHFSGAFERQTGAPPYALPARWLEARSRLRLDTPLNFVGTHDIIGGNSGSPVINQAAEVVGLVFDSNVYGLAGDFGYDDQKARSIAVDVRGILEGLETIYGAHRLAKELRGETSRF